MAHGADRWHPGPMTASTPDPARGSRSSAFAGSVPTPRDHAPAGGPPARRPAPGEQRALSLAPVPGPALSPSRSRPPPMSRGPIRRHHHIAAHSPYRAQPKRKRGEGQWKLGYREPLNPNERTKKDDDGLNVRARIENVYAKRGFDSIDPADLRGRMRWWGLYTQRRPGIDGGRTAALEPEELDDRYFMLRVRIDGGALTTEQLRLVGEISRDHARDTADVTDRQNIQYHWIEIEDMPAIWQKLESQRPAHHRGLRGHPAGDPRLAGGRHRRRREDRPAAGHRRDPRPLHRQQGVLQPAAQVQDRDLLAAGRGARGERRVVHRRRAPRARPRLRRLGRRRAVHQPEDRAAARRLGAAGRGARRLGRHHRDLPRLRLPAAAAPGPDQVPGRRLGRRGVPPGAGGGVPAPPAGRRPGPGDPGRADRPRRRAQAARRAQLRRRRAGVRAGVRVHADRAGRRRGAGRLGPGAAHPAAEDRRAGRGRRRRSSR